jgi:hypothetical protein
MPEVLSILEVLAYIITTHQGIQLEGHMHSHSREQCKLVSCQRSEEANSLTFDGDHKKGEEAKVWLFGMRKYFKLHNYLSNLEAKIAI